MCMTSTQAYLHSFFLSDIGMHHQIGWEASSGFLSDVLWGVFFFFQLWALLRSLMENQKLLHLLFNSDQRSAERWTIWRKISLRTSLHVATSITKFTPHSMKIPPPFSSVGTASAGYRLLGYNRCRAWNSAQRGQFLLHDIRESIKHRESFRCCLANQINTPFTQSCYLLAAPRWKHDL